MITANCNIYIFNCPVSCYLNTSFATKYTTSISIPEHKYGTLLMLNTTLIDKGYVMHVPVCHPLERSSILTFDHLSPTLKYLVFSVTVLPLHFV
jgi:hypothetical protein